ncbi:MAG: hypothetical protein QN144_14210 [Armatimonadota bacterium]|nr:hypothetical protein [Armatimonadota bacterium]MDR7417243.1 hypothetical protein [Armatimonadota bacterium]
MAVALGLPYVLARPGAAAPAGYPKPFSAEFDLLVGGTLRRVRVHATPRLIRLERGGGEAVVIYDSQADRARVLFPVRREYTEVPGPSEAAEFLPVPAAGPCPVRRPAGARCRQAGTDRVAGRPAVKWEVGTAALTHHVWVDRELGLVLRKRVQGRDTVLARRVTVGPQPAELFRVPAGYRRVP